MRLRRFALFLAVAIAAIPLTSALGAPGDRTWLRTFEEDFYNWATPHEATFEFPDGSVNYSRILLHYTIACPGAPADCDPWDRIGYLQVVRETEPDVFDNVEIARIITPYDITGGSRPGTCTWTLDVSDYEPLLQGTVTLRNYIESWIGDERGWLVTIDFEFVEGEWVVEPVEIVNLWNQYYAVYGDPDRPIEDHLQPLDVDIPAGAAAAKVRVITTGHGQGNTANCAEFCSREHTIVAGADSFSRDNWRSDCELNTCSPQGGTWALDRAGWCPGDGVRPWEIDVSGSIVPGGTVTFDYDLEPYENFCRPTNPDCVDGVTCADCDYNFTGHTEPHQAIASQLIIYETGTVVGVDDAAAGAPDIVVNPNSPNPFNPRTTISYTLASAETVTLVILDAGGREVRHITRSHDAPGKHRVSWNGRDDAGRVLPTGVYFYEVRGSSVSGRRKMVLLK